MPHYNPVIFLSPMYPPPSTSTAQPASVRRRNRHHILLTWCLWLIGSWALAMAGESVKIASNLVMPFAAMIGLMVLWPMLRLSQGQGQGQGQGHPVTGGPSDKAGAIAIGAPQLLGEWLSMNLVFQAVIWPLMLNAQWTFEQTVWLNSAIAGWSLLAGMITAWGCRAVTGWGRTLAMVLCLLMVLGEPVIMGLISTVTAPPGAGAGAHPGAGAYPGAGAGVGAGAGGGWTMRLSPIRLIWDLTRSFVNDAGQTYGPQVIAVVIAAVIGWATLAIIRRRA